MSNNRLTDEQVAHAVADYDDVTVTNALAREVQAYRALRPDCPTCEGSGRGKHPHLIVDPADIDANGHLIPYPCPDCTDGKMPLDKWVALLVDTLHHCADWFKLDLDDGCPGCPEDAIDAVLKMVPK